MLILSTVTANLLSFLWLSVSSYIIYSELILSCALCSLLCALISYIYLLSMWNIHVLVFKFFLLLSLSLFLKLCLCAQSSPTLCDSIDSSMPASSVYGIFRQRYWTGLPFPSQGDLPNLGNEPLCLMSLALVGRFFIISTTWEAPI